ncbi:MAG: lamin tail domain-containing protein, partial [Planctomycetota bacterium]
MNSHSLRTTTQTALTGLVLTASLLAQGAGSSSIRINEVVYDDEGNDDREFVELFNGGASPVDLGGFLIQIDTPGGALPPYPIPSGTVIDPRGFVVLGGANAMHLTVPLVSPQTGGDLFPDGPATMILIDPLGQPIDAFAYQTGSAQWPTAHLEGDGFVGSLQSLDNLPLSIQRIFDGHDTDRNGRDFVVQEQTPGESNNRSTFSPVTRFDLLGREIGSQLLPVEMLGINSIQPLIVDPQLPPTPGLPTLLQPVPPSPFGPNVLALGDPMFAGPQSTSYVIPQQQASRFIVESYVYIDPQPMPQGGFEGFALGVGSTSEFRLQEQGDPLGISQQNGNTGASLIYRSTEFGNELLIVDHNDGGFGPQAQSPEQVVAAFPVDPAMFGGWQRVRFEVLPECIFVRVGGTVGQDDGIEFSVFHDGSPLLVYAGYETNGLGARRPLLLDGLTIRGPKSMDIGLQEVPYVQGASIGPLTSPVDPGREAEEKVYAQAYWTAHDSSGADTAALQAFQFSQGVTDAPGAYSCDEDPFVQGYQLFREIYSHRLQLDPRFPLYDLDDLIRD